MLIFLVTSCKRSLEVPIIKLATGIAGLNNAGHSNNGIRRLVWMIIFFAGLAGTLHSVIVVVKEIFEFPVDTTITIHTDTSVSWHKWEVHHKKKYISYFTD